MRFLIFRLYGPLASWGQAAVGETRPSASAPGRSAIIGLLAAALGIRRTDETAQRELRDAVSIAIKESSAGVLLRDYHTTQVPAAQRNVRHHLRRDELAVPESQLHTILSSREYRCDGYWSVAVRLGDDAPWTLEELAERLHAPCFTLYLGRKSFPLAAPLSPWVVEAAGVREALASTFPALTPLPPVDERRWLGLGSTSTLAWEGEGGDVTPTETRYPTDEPLHRGRWQFAMRPESRTEIEEEG